MKKSSKKTTLKVAATKENLIWIVFVLDRSGSMQSIRMDMIGGYNAFIQSQKNAKLGKCKVFAYKFDNVYEAMYEGIDLEDVPELTQNDFVPRNGTALYDAVGKTINNISALINSLSPDQRPDKVLFATITDGLNNESKEFTSESVATLREEKAKDNWDFAYIGANQDAWAVGDSMGYTRGTTMNYVATAGGTSFMFDKLSKSTVSYRACAGKKFSFDDDDEDKNVPPITPPTP
jgi:hypothetical protein